MGTGPGSRLVPAINTAQVPVSRLFLWSSRRRPGSSIKSVRSTRHSLAASPHPGDDQRFGCCKVLPVCARHPPEACTRCHSPLASRPSSRHSGKRACLLSRSGQAFSGFASSFAAKNPACAVHGPGTRRADAVPWLTPSRPWAAVHVSPPALRRLFIPRSRKYTIVKVKSHQFQQPLACSSQAA